MLLLSLLAGGGEGRDNFTCRLTTFSQQLPCVRSVTRCQEVKAPSRPPTDASGPPPGGLDSSALKQGRVPHIPRSDRRTDPHKSQGTGPQGAGAECLGEPAPLGVLASHSARCSLPCNPHGGPGGGVVRKGPLGAGGGSSAQGTRQGPRQAPSLGPALGEHRAPLPAHLPSGPRWHRRAVRDTLAWPRGRQPPSADRSQARRDRTGRERAAAGTDTEARARACHTHLVAAQCGGTPSPARVTL